MTPDLWTHAVIVGCALFGLGAAFGWTVSEITRRQP